MHVKMPRPNEDVSPSHGVSTTVSPSFSIPPHVMGRTVNNPTMDSSGPGRRLQKPRPGMRIPYRNLTSQIVTQDEIAEEILKRQMKRSASAQPRVLLCDSLKSKALHFPGSGNAIFAKSLSQKLANQLTSPSDGEEKSSNGLGGSNAVMWPQVQVEGHEHDQFINSHGSYAIKDKLSVELINCDSNGIDGAEISHKKTSTSPRINHQKTPKLDREAEKEMALKQLKELPNIKDPESTVRRKNLIKSDSSLQLSLMTAQSDLKAYYKVEAKGSNGNEEKHNVTSGDCSSEVRQGLSSTLNSGNGKLMNSPSKSVHPPHVPGNSEVKGSDAPNKFRALNKSFPKKTKLQGRKMLKSNLPNGHCKKIKKENARKRRSARLSDKDVEGIEKKSPKKLPPPPNGEVKKRKRGRPSNAEILARLANQSNDSSSFSPVAKAETRNSSSGESSPKKARISIGNSSFSDMDASSAGHLSVVSPVSLKVESSCALKAPVVQAVMQSQAESKEIKKERGSTPGKQGEPKKRNKHLTEVEKLMKDEGAASMLMETGTLGSGHDSIKPELIDNKKVMKSKELEKLFRDEGVVNMLIGTIPFGQQMIIKRSGKSQPQILRKATRQKILYKTNLARKSVRLNSALPSRLRPKTIFKRKQEIERKRMLDEKKRQLFAKRESGANQLDKKPGVDVKKVQDEKKNVEDEKLERLSESIEKPKIPLKHERDSSLSIDMSLHRFSLPLAAKASRIIRRHSSSSSFSSRSSSPVGMVSKSRRGSSSSNSPKEMPISSRDSKCLEQLALYSEPSPDTQVKGNADTSRLSCIPRCSSSRKVVAVPRMSAAVRLKLNSEMSKNFQKGLNVENAKSISAKVNSSPKAKKSPIQFEQSFKLNSVIDVKLQSPIQASTDIKTPLLRSLSEVKLSPSVEIIQDPHPISPSASHVVPSNPVSANVLCPPPLKDLDMISGGELAVCVKKLQERKEVSITAINECGERTVEIPSSTPATIPLVTSRGPETCATSVIPHQIASSSGVLVEVVPKIKKYKTPKVPFLKNIMGKEHRIVGLPLSPIASYNSVMKSLENVAQKHKKKPNSKMGKLLESKESFRQRSSGRQNAGTYNYKEICLRRHENFVQLILTPCSTKMKNSLNVQVLHEFRDALQQLRRDECCRVVLVTSTGSSFCQGLDLHSLLHTNIERRKKAALELSEALKEFLRVLAMFNKPIVAGVHGATVGLGVTMLPFFDVVYASDKATFHAPYARLGQIPEGAAVLTLPLMLGNAVTSELLFGSRKLTASEALHYGLVTRVFWPDTFQEELIPNITAMATQSSQSMQAMKALLRLNLRVKLEATLDSESSLLVQHWCSPECQRNFRRFLETSDEIFLQRQKKDPC
ncbi:uncharacterized protein LOC124163918 isoform X2 [Ischnura elegans]|uniref:uncharacterized protein LOC124163918 isoform X2 n=1 Tax=Ischnura elegans TaxID=197161 RepID=UPI001ED8A434|nr:uncharacterized protein LOC124163918 isoform X2 [Ischnura elegans]